MEWPQLKSGEVVKVEQFFDQHFGERVWRLGFYNQPDTTPTEASEVAVKRLVRLLSSIKKSHRVLCIGAQGINLGLYLVEEYQCKVNVLCNEALIDESSYQKIVSRGYPEKMTIDRGSIRTLPYDWEVFDMVVSVEALGFEERKEDIFQQISSVLKPKGRVLFTSLFHSQAQNHSSIPLITKEEYLQLLARTDLGSVLNMEMTEHFVRHYTALEHFANEHKTALNKHLGQPLAKKFSAWLSAYATHLPTTNLEWGVFLFQKSNL